MNREAVWLPAQPLWLFPPAVVREGWDGGVLVAGIAPIPTFPRCRGKETISVARCIEKPSVAMFALK